MQQSLTAETQKKQFVHFEVWKLLTESQNT